MIQPKRVWAGTLAVCTVVVVSCSGPGGEGDTKQLPSIKDIRSRLESDRELNPDQPGVFAVLRVVEVSLPLEAPTERAWDQTTPVGLNPSAVQAWNANGMRLGVLKADGWAAFSQALQDATGRRQTRIKVSQQRVRLLASPVYAGVAEFEVVGADGAAQTHRFAKGRCQLLGRVVEQPDGGATLELVPHYFQSRVSLEVRPPQERAMDGVLFDAMSVGVTLPTQGVLVMGLDPRTAWAEVWQPAEQINTPAEDSPPATTPETPPNEEEQPQKSPEPRRVLRDNLGARLLTVSRLGKPTQTVVAITADWPDAGRGVDARGDGGNQR